MYADYVVKLRIKWPCFLPKILKIRAALLKLLVYYRLLTSVPSLNIPPIIEHEVIPSNSAEEIMTGTETAFLQ